MHIDIIDEIRASQILHNHKANSWDLCFQKVLYVESESNQTPGYRFIYRDKDNKLLPQRGQARIPDLKIANAMLAAAEARSWSV